MDQLTFLRLRDLSLALHPPSHLLPADLQHHIPRAVHPYVAVADNVHYEAVPAGLRGGLELHLECLHRVRRSTRLFVDRGFAESGHREGRHGYLAHFWVRKEDVPSWRMVAGEVGRVREGWEEGDVDFFVVGHLCFVWGCVRVR